MSRDTYANLEQACTQLARRRNRPAWLDQIGFGSLDIDALVIAVRNNRPDHRCSDATIRTLATAGQTHPDPLTILLHALAPALRAQLARSITDEYRADALADLTFVILDAVERRDLATSTRLGHRLIHRTHTRISKRAARTRTRGYRDIKTIEPEPPEIVVRLLDQCRTVNDIADEAVTRADFAAFHATIMRAIEAGDLTANAWQSYRDHRLRPTVVRTAASPPRVRTATFRAAQQVHACAEMTLVLAVA